MKNFLILLLLSSFFFNSVKAQIKEFHLQNLDLAEEDDFGSSVSNNEEWVAVGARRWMNETGKVLMYKSSANDWLLKNDVIGSQSVEGDFFGTDIAMTDRHMVVGAPTDHWVSGIEGKAYVYELVSNEWVETSTLYPPDYFEASAYGFIVNIHKDKIVVGAPDQNFRGSVVVYVQQGSEWVEQQVLSASGNNKRDFGGAIDMIDEWLVIGQYDSVVNEGTALEILLYKWESGQFVFKQSIMNERVFLPHQIPYWNMELSEDQLIVGNHRVNNGENITGGTKVYTLNGDTWELDQTLSPAGFELHELGRHVALSERFAMFGASNYPASNFDEPHHVIFYEKSNPDSWNLIGTFSYEGNSFLNWQGFNFDIAERFATTSTGNAIDEHGDVYIYDLREFVVTSTQELANVKIELLPNITRDNVTVRSTSGINSLVIYNDQGGVVYRESFKMPLMEKSLLLPEIPQGTYFIYLETEAGNLIKKLIKI